MTFAAFSVLVTAPAARRRGSSRVSPAAASTATTSITIAQRAGIRSLGRVQEGLKDETGELIEKLEGAPVFALTLAWERRLTRRGGEPLLDLPLFRDRAFAAGTAVNFALVFFFGSFMFVLTLLLQAGLGQSPLRAGLEAGPLALAFTTMSILGPRLAATGR